MIIEKSFNLNIEESIRRHWSTPALSDYGQHTMQYSDVAEGIAMSSRVFTQRILPKSRSFLRRQVLRRATRLLYAAEI